MKLRYDRREEPDVNLTPLIDVVFLLLIFFMVSTTFNRETEINIDLPEASGQAIKTEPQVVEIGIDDKGRYFVNKQELVNSQTETLKSAIKQAVGDAQKPQLILSADRNTPYQFVIRAMDASRQLGYVNLTFAAVKPQENP